jgi:hypothetical protein
VHAANKFHVWEREGEESLYSDSFPPFNICGSRVCEKLDYIIEVGK